MTDGCDPRMGERHRGKHGSLFSDWLVAGVNPPIIQDGAFRSFLFVTAAIRQEEPLPSRNDSGCHEQNKTLVLIC